MEDERTDEQVEAENAKMREDVMAEVWGTEAQAEEMPPTEAPEPEAAPEAAPAPADPVADLRAELRNVIAAFNAQETRLKQAESRVGSLQNKLYLAEQAAKSVENAPTKKEMADASESDAAWKELKEEYPEWAALTGAIEKKFSALPVSKAGVDEEAVERRMVLLQQNLIARMEQEAAERKLELEATKLSLRHPDWESDVNTPEYKHFISTAPPEVQVLTKSILAKDAARVLDLFHDSRKGNKTAAQIAAGRRKTLSSSQEQQPRGARPPISMDNLSKEELWNVISKEVWDT